MGYEPCCVMLPVFGEEHPVYFRTLTKKEFTELTQDFEYKHPEETKYLGDLYSGRYEEIINAALLWPNPLPDTYPAATDKLVAEAILDASAWVSTDRLTSGLFEARQEASSLDGFLKSRIFAAFPTMSIEKINSLKFTEMIELVAMSEVITGVEVDLQPWLDPEGYQKRIEREKRRERAIIREREAGLNIDPRMKDPAFMRKLISSAQESRERLEQHRQQEDHDLKKMQSMAERNI